VDNICEGTFSFIYNENRTTAHNKNTKIKTTIKHTDRQWQKQKRRTWNCAICQSNISSSQNVVLGMHMQITRWLLDGFSFNYNCYFIWLIYENCNHCYLRYLFA